MVASAGELTRLAETWREPVTGDALMLDAMRIIEMGCEYLLVTNTQTDLQSGQFLFDESGLVRQMPGRACRVRSSVPARPLGGAHGNAGQRAGSTAGSLRGAGIHPGQLANAQRIGMGKLVPDRYFWARESEDPDAPPASTELNPGFHP
jgi:hydroxymethylpyrimidine/phosphomethylpyrimidine kinase